MPALAEKIETPATSLEAAQHNGSALMSWRREMGINRPTFATIANCSERTLATYEKKPHFPPSFERQISEALRLLKALSEIIPTKELKIWLKTANTGFGNRSPLHIIAEGESDLLWEMVHQTQQSTYT